MLVLKNPSVIGPHQATFGDRAVNLQTPLGELVCLLRQLIAGSLGVGGLAWLRERGVDGNGIAASERQPLGAVVPFPPAVDHARVAALRSRRDGVDDPEEVDRLADVDLSVARQNLEVADAEAEPLERLACLVGPVADDLEAAFDDADDVALRQRRDVGAIDERRLCRVHRPVRKARRDVDIRDLPFAELCRHVDDARRVGRADEHVVSLQRLVRMVRVKPYVDCSCHFSSLPLIVLACHPTLRTRIARLTYTSVLTVADFHRPENVPFSGYPPMSASRISNILLGVIRAPIASSASRNSLLSLRRSLILSPIISTSRCSRGYMTL